MEVMFIHNKIYIVLMEGKKVQNKETKMSRNPSHNYAVHDPALSFNTIYMLEKKIALPNIMLHIKKQFDIHRRPFS